MVEAIDYESDESGIVDGDECYTVGDDTKQYMGILIRAIITMMVDFDEEHMPGVPEMTTSEKIGVLRYGMNNVIRSLRNDREV